MRIRKLTFQCFFFACLVVVATLIPVQSSDGVSDYDRFKLWNKCRPVNVSSNIGWIGETFRTMGLTRERIHITVKKRLSEAGIYGGERHLTASGLDVGVSARIRNPMFQVELTLSLYMVNSLDRKKRPRQSYTLVSWKDSIVTEHRGDVEIILRSVAELTDQFINEYLRVNTEACT